MICFNDLRIQAVWQSYQRNMERKQKASLMDRMHYPESATTWAFLRGPNQYWNSLWVASPHVAGSLKPRTSPRSIKHGLTQPCVYVICMYIYIHIINILCKYIYYTYVWIQTNYRSEIGTTVFSLMNSCPTGVGRPSFCPSIRSTCESDFLRNAAFATGLVGVMKGYSHRHITINWDINFHHYISLQHIAAYPPIDSQASGGFRWVFHKENKH
jgi:hypothetical protein